MPPSNVFIHVDTPDDLIAGRSPLAGFKAKFIQLWRWPSEQAARAGDTGAAVLAETFTLKPSSAEAETPNVAGPFRYGTYDGNQTLSSWYRYRFADADGLAYSPLSEPWEADGSPEWALRDILFEVGDLLGGSVIKGTAATNADATKIVCPQLWQSTARDPRVHDNWWVLVVSGDAEGEEALISGPVDADTGTATLERALGAAVTEGDQFLVSAYLQPSEMIRAINRAREKMQVLATVDIALASDEDRYPAPHGVRAVTDVVEAFGVFQYANSRREDLFPVDFDVEFDGVRGWLYLNEYPGAMKMVRLRVLRSYRDMEGNLTAMGDVTNAPIEWLRPAAAYAVAEFLVDSDPTEPEYQRLKGKFESSAAEASGRFAPQVVRRAVRGAGRRILPGPLGVR